MFIYLTLAAPFPKFPPKTINHSAVSLPHLEGCMKKILVIMAVLVAFVALQSRVRAQDSTGAAKEEKKGEMMEKAGEMMKKKGEMMEKKGEKMKDETKEEVKKVPPGNQ